VAKKELINGYSELNDPFEQASKFQQQAHDRQEGDQETPPFDSEYVQVLKLGLPPTVGWGIGIDRLVMFLTNSSSIREVIPFTPMK
jgi:lysyl-tRNA synthetase class 2